MAARPFTDTVVALRYGNLHDELTESLNELVQNCATSGKTGTLTLTLKIKPGKGGQMEILDEVKTVQPKEEKATTIMFSTPEGNLQREDPRQLSIQGLRVVDRPNGPLKGLAESSTSGTPAQVPDQSAA